MVPSVNSHESVAGNRSAGVLVGSGVKRLISLPLVLLALVAGLLAACGDDDPTTAVADESPSASDQPAIPADGLLVRVDRSGGFVPVDVAFADTPDVSIYGDGTVLTPGAMIMIYPGPALGSLQEAMLDAAAIEAIYAKADELGMLDGELDYGQPPVADAPDTIVTLVTESGTVEHRANALAEGADADPSAMSDEQRDNREKLLELVQAIDAAAASSLAGDGGGYEPVAYRVRAESGEVPPPSDVEGEPEPRVVDWPVDLLEPSQIRECTAFESDAARRIEELFADADQLTWFRDAEGATWRVMVRPVLPDEEACPEA